MRYYPIIEKPYCCVPAVLQMIQARRGLGFLSQEEIGWELGLIVPPELKDSFRKVRTGPKPKEGYGTRTLNPKFSINNYFVRNKLPLNIIKYSVSSCEELNSVIVSALDRDDDVILCLNSLQLFGAGDLEHVMLIDRYNKSSGQITVVDPAISGPAHRIIKIDKIFETIKEHSINSLGGLWIIFEQTKNT